MEQIMSTEEELLFKRFPAEKQEQVRQLVAYAQLMGLDGKDLVSIGGKLDRIRASAEYRRNKSLVETLFTFLYVGRDAGEYDLNNRWRIKTDSGSYTFQAQGWDVYRVRSNRTGTVRDHRVVVADYSLGSGDYYKRRRYAVMLDVCNGLLPLNF
jgi:hypothetical protein